MPRNDAEVFVNPEVIRMIIGPGGKNIKAITAATGASVDIEDSGRISIFAPTAESMEQAKELVQYYDQRPDLGKNYMGKVRKVLEIGAIVEIMPNVEASCTSRSSIPAAWRRLPTWPTSAKTCW